MKKFEKIAFIFPGQGSQYPGMGKDFVGNYSAARLAYEEADDLLNYKLSEIILKGPDTALIQTKNSQPGIYVFSMAILRVMQEVLSIKPFVCAGLSLGEYSALTATESLSFIDCLPLIQTRANLMSQACDKHHGTMAVIMGMEGAEVEKIVQEVNLPHDLWIANYNCPGQIVISGTIKGVEAGIAAAKVHGAKRVLPLQVQGAFHSGLMRAAEEQLSPHIKHAGLKKGTSQMVMNVPGDFVTDLDSIRENMINQVTHSVKWEQGIRAMDAAGVDLFIEIGPGKTLSGMNKRIGVKAPTLNVETLEDFEKLAHEVV